jgi:hypothetical protein
MAPTALAILVATFEHERERTTALVALLYAVVEAPGAG